MKEETKWRQGEEEEEEATTEAKEEESDEMPPLGHQSKLVIKNVSDMLYDHYQAVYERMDKQNERHKNMYEKLATTSSILAHRQDSLWESVDSLVGCTRDLLAHPSMQKRHQGVVPRLVVREMLPWDELLDIPSPYPPLQGNGGQD